MSEEWPTEGRIRVRDRRVYRGPNYWSYDPAIRFVVDLGVLEDWPTSRLPGFTERLVGLLPGLRTHSCSRGYAGGFLERLAEGTWLGHVAEHVALEVQRLTGSEIRRGKTRGTGTRGEYNIIFGYADETVGLASGDLGVRIVNHLVHAEEGFDVQKGVEDLIRTANKVAFGPSTQAIVDEATARDIPWLRLDEHSLVQLGQGVHQRRIRATMTSETPVLGTDIASDKALTSRLLAAAGLPVPGTTVVRSLDEARRVARKLGYPVVLKPLDGNHGRGVGLDIRDDEALAPAYDAARAAARRGGVVVERFVPGADHRLLVVGGRLVAAALRRPAHVVGDGAHTLEELVEKENADPRRGIGHEKVLTRITLDDNAVRLAAQQGYAVTDVVPAGARVQLTLTGNMSTGGTAEDVTELVHPDNVEIAELAAEVVGLDVAGIDLVTPDITESVHDVGGAIVEVNAAPGFRMHTHPTKGEPQYVAKPVVDLLFPAGAPSRIPIVAVTGTNGKTTTTRMIAHVFRRVGRQVGLTSTDGIAIGDRLIIPGDSSGPRSARMVLQNPRVDLAVFEVARGGILREGLGYERNDVAVVLNVAADHLGLRGIDTIEELARVKQVVVEAVPRHGYAVLNADDPLVYEMRRACSGDVVLFTMRDGNDDVERHVRRGGRAVVLETDDAGVERIVFRHGGRSQAVVRTDALPATFGGRARMNVQNAMAATGAALVAGAHLQDVRLALQSFTTSFETSPGRLNMTQAGGVTIVVDYCHNAHGMHMLGDFVDRWTADAAPGARRVGMVAIPGDRRDEDITDLGRAAAPHFDHLVIPHEVSLRGRQPGEMAALVLAGVEDAVHDGAKPPSTEVAADETASVTAALAAAAPGDLVVLCAENPGEVWDLVNRPTARD